MSVVLDTGVLIDHLRASEAAAAYLAGLTERPVCSEVTRIEVMQGLRTAERKPAERLFSLVAWVPVDERISRRAGELGRKWRRSNPGIGVADLAIAATVEQVGGVIATRNAKHFPMFKGLRAPY